MQDARRRLVGVVDDDAGVRDSLRFLLEAAGFAVATFESAEHFQTAAERDSIACLLLDHHMPRVTGLELLGDLRHAGWTVPVALMTGSPSAELLRRALELDAVVVLEKPLSDRSLFEFIGNACT